MVFCTQCGSQLKDTAKFCKYCGYKLKNVSKTQENELRSSSSQSSQSSSSIQEKSLYSSSLYNTSGTKKIDPNTSHPPLVAPEGPPLGESLDAPDVYAPVPSSSKETLIVSSKQGTQTSLVAKQSYEFPSISQDIIEVLGGRTRLEEIKSEMTTILDEITKIEQRLTVGLIDSTTAKEQITNKQTQLAQLRAEKEKIPVEELPYETYIKQLAQTKEKRSKLDVMRKDGKISREAVYQKLESEYTAEIDQLESQIDIETRRLRQWSKQLDEDVKNYYDQIELLKAKAELGEVGVNESSQKQQEMKIDAELREKARKTLDSVLSSS